MENTSLVGTALLILTGLSTYKGLKDYAFNEYYNFNVDGILVKREFFRLLSSGFLHVGWIHFAFNMVGLLSFANALEPLFGIPKFLVIYFLSMLGGSLLSLYIHRNHGDYRAVGASGAVSGIIFSSIVLFPEHEIGFILLPIQFKSWILGVLFVVISIWGIKSQKDNIGHEAHLGGALTGLLITILLQPSVLQTNLWVILLLGLPTLAFLILLIRNPAVLMIDNYWGENFRAMGNRFKRDSKKTSSVSPQEEMDNYLDKIKKHGFKSLSDKEKKRINELRDSLK